MNGGTGVWLVSEVAIVLLVSVSAALAFFVIATRPKKCPHCGKSMQLTVDDRASHKKYRCRGCGKTVKTEIPVGRHR